MDPDYKYESDKDQRLVEDLSAKTLVGVRRTAWICKYCDGVYADDPVSSCDCLGADGQTPPHFVEGELKYLSGANPNRTEAMNINEIPTPESDAEWNSPDVCTQFPELAYAMREKSKDLERRLAVCRELLASLDPYPDEEIEPARYGVYCEMTTTEIIAIRETLTLTAPKP